MQGRTPIGTPHPGAEELRTRAPGHISLREVTKGFTRTDGVPVKAVDSISLEIDGGDFCVLLGPSGCGKTTLLRCLAGLERPDAGEITVGERTFYSSTQGASLTPQQRGLGMVFQSYALWPHMSVERNVAFPMTTRRRRRQHSREEVRRRVHEALEVVGIPELASQPISRLSGGQQQRVALARAIAFGSDVVLFDEPLSNVDAKVRVQLRQEIHALQRELGFTAIYVTHDQEEAMELADVLVVLREGQVEQSGPPRDLYRAPASRYVADFVGTADLLDGTVLRSTADGVLVATAIGEVQVGHGPAVAAGDEVSVVVRAEDWRVTPAADDPAGSSQTASPQTSNAWSGNAWSGTVQLTAYLGASTQYLVRVGDEAFRVRPQGSTQYAEGQQLHLALDPADLHLVTR